MDPTDPNDLEWQRTKRAGAMMPNERWTLKSLPLWLALITFLANAATFFAPLFRLDAPGEAGGHILIQGYHYDVVDLPSIYTLGNSVEIPMWPAFLGMMWCCAMLVYFGQPLSHSPARLKRYAIYALLCQLLTIPSAYGAAWIAHGKALEKVADLMAPTPQWGLGIYVLTSLLMLPLILSPGAGAPR